MKKLLIASLAVMLATSANAFSLKKMDIGSDSMKLTKCAMDEGTKSLNRGELTKDNVDSVARQIATVCATKLALKNVDDATVEVVAKVLRGLVK